MKMVLALEKGVIPATIGVQDFNRNLRLANRNVRVITRAEAFESPYPRVGINSFGYGGANAHVILESAKAYWNPEPGMVGQPDLERTFLLPLSAHNKKTLENRAADLRDLKLYPKQLGDLAYTLANRRTRFSTRGFLLVQGESMSEDISIDKVESLESTSSQPLPLTFVFTGQGVQWPTMGIHLMERYPVFLRSIQRLDACLAKLPHPPNWTLESKLVE
jgi:acyl transferase domain-containing protein